MYTLSADLSRGRDKNSYTIYDTETNTVVYCGDDLEEVRKYGFQQVSVDEQDTDLLFTPPNHITSNR